MPHYTNPATDRVVQARLAAQAHAKSARGVQLYQAALATAATLPADDMLQAIARAYDKGDGL